MLAVILVYSDRLPEALKGQKYFFEWQNVLSYLYLTILPIHKFSVALVVTLPPLLVAAYV